MLASQFVANTPLVLGPGLVLPEGIVIDHLLKQGGLSSVWLATHHGGPIVVKSFRLDPEWTNEQRAECHAYFLNEAHYLEVLRHQRIIRGLGTIQSANATFILMEFIPGADLRTWMDTNRPLRRLDVFYPIASSCAEGIWYLYSKRLIHRDIAPRNLMVGQDLKTTLIDLQFVCPEPFTVPLPTRSTEMSYGLGHWAFSAPEVMDGLDQTYDHRADIYSLGAVLIELLVGRPPRRRTPAECRPDLPTGLSEVLWAMVDETPSNRPNWSDIGPMLNAPHLTRCH